MASKSCIFVCLRLTKWIPVVFIAAILSWSYYAYVFQLCLITIDDFFKKAVYLILYHIFLGLYVWSYYQTIFTPIQKPPGEFYLLETDIYQMEISQNELTTKLILERKAKELPLLTRTNNLSIRYCDKCKCVKPDRAHHCGVCETCVLKMDHHCPWVNNCIGFSNYKYFILFLGYSVVYCIFVAITSAEYFIQFWNEIQTFQPGRFNLLFLFFVSIVFAISIFSLLAYHIYLVGKNCTTLESFRPPVFSSTGLPDKDGFSLNKLENFKQVFGPNLITAFLPIFTSTNDGINFPTSIRQTLAANRPISSTTNFNIQSSSNPSDALLLNDRSYSTDANQLHISMEP